MPSASHDKRRKEEEEEKEERIEAVRGRARSLTTNEGGPPRAFKDKDNDNKIQGLFVASAAQLSGSSLGLPCVEGPIGSVLAIPPRRDQRCV